MEIAKLIEEMKEHIEQLSKKEGFRCEDDAQYKVEELSGEIYGKINQVLEWEEIRVDYDKLQGIIRDVILGMHIQDKLSQNQVENADSIFKSVKRFFSQDDNRTTVDEMDEFMASQKSEYPDAVVEGRREVIKKDNRECEKLLDEIIFAVEGIVRNHPAYYEIKRVLRRIDVEEISSSLIDITSGHSRRLEAAMDEIIGEFDKLKGKLNDTSKQNPEDDRSAFADSRDEFMEMWKIPEL